MFMPAMEKLVKSNLEEAVLELFSYVPPGTLKKSIHEIFCRYLQTINNETHLEQFKLLAEDFYFLHKFLERVEEMEE
jgi:hypothetical protein